MSLLTYIRMGAALAPNFNGDLRIVNITPIPEEIRRLQVISCDVCNAAKALYDVYATGAIDGVQVLKRYCDTCAKSLTQ